MEHVTPGVCFPARASAFHPDLHERFARGFDVSAADRKPNCADYGVVHPLVVAFDVRDRFVDGARVTDAAVLTSGRLEFEHDRVRRVLFVQQAHPPAREPAFGITVQERCCSGELLSEVPEVDDLYEVAIHAASYLGREMCNEIVRAIAHQGELEPRTLAQDLVDIAGDAVE